MTYFIACDIDHTLLNDKGDLLEENVLAINKARALGATVVLSTARSYSGAKPIHDALDLDTPMVVSNGTLVCEKDGFVLKAYTLEQATARLVAQLYQETPHHWSFRTSETAYIHPEFQTENSPFSDPDQYKPTDPLELEDLTKGYATLITASLFGTDVRSFYEQHAWDSMNLVSDYYPPSHYTHLETMSNMSKLANKGNGVKWLRNYLGQDNAVTISLGDSAADATMFPLGIGIAPANSPESVKAQATWVAPHCDDNAVAAALEKYMFQDVELAVQAL